ncbi:uncharacterized protein LOC131633331 [Vicia villosa]|uniref:uncharacterized protein LOC131633331 n=1 Tax=Vicia villosa TaxID=3911 RepID=UPI00273C3F64|nr:uncharacterized protein LOC131633331 [Vicia villosa]
MARNNNNNQVPDPFHLDPLIHAAIANGQNRNRREGQESNADEQGRPRHEISQPARNEQAQIQNNEADSKDGHPTSSFTHTSQRQETQYENNHEQVDIPEDADPTTVLLLAALKKINRLIQQQSERIDKLERKRRSRSPLWRHYRSRSSSSSRSPPRRHRRRSPSSSRSPPKRYRRRRSNSRSPR